MPFHPPRGPRQSGGGRSSGPVHSIGRRVFVNCPRNPAGGVVLTDETGRGVSRPLADGVEVTIVAWRPRGGAGTRYRVHAPQQDAEGWLGAEDLRAGRQPTPPPPVDARREAEPAPPREGARRFGQRR